jgi:hypothetical protein
MSGTYFPPQVSKLAEGIAMSMSTGKAEINVTPLIDVLLVLIIIFMVVLPEHSVGLPAQRFRNLFFGRVAAR